MNTTYNPALLVFIFMITFIMIIFIVRASSFLFQRISVVVQRFNSVLLHDGFVDDDRPAGSLTAGICALLTALHYNVIHLAVTLLSGRASAARQTVQTSSVDCLTAYTNMWLTCPTSESVCYSYYYMVNLLWDLQPVKMLKLRNDAIKSLRPANKPSDSVRADWSRRRNAS